MAGGQVDDFEPTNTVVEYDPATDRWSLVGTLPRALEGTIVQLLGNQLIVTGGYDGQSGLATNITYTGTFAG